MPDFGRPGNGVNGEPSFDDIRRSDDFIDALANGRPVAPQDPADAELAALLGGWRDESRWPPSTGLVSEQQTVAALTAGLAEKPEKPRNNERRGSSGPPKHHRRGLSVIGTVAAATLFIGGFGAVVAGAGPGDALYGLRSMLFGESRQVRDDAVALAARTELNQVQEMITRGDWQQAQEKLVAVSSQVASIGDQQQKQELLEEFNDLSAKVVERNPEATAAPGIVYTVPPEATELVPALAPPSSEPATSSESATSSPATSSPEASSEPATSSPASASETTSGTPTTATSGTSATTPSSAATTPSSTATTPSSTATTPSSTATTPSSTATTTPATTSAAQQSQAATTPTSAAPSTASSPAATTTAAPSPAEATPTSEAAEAAETAETTTAAEAAETAETTTAAGAAGSAEAVQTAGEPPAAQEEPLVTTTVVVPVP